MELYSDISQALQRGRVKLVRELTQKAIDGGASAADVLNKGLLPGMDVIGVKFKNNEIYLPEVIIAARAMSAGSELLRPLLAGEGVKAAGSVCIGTVKGDMHDIGKNLVKMMMEGKGLNVVDLGADVAPERFISSAVENNCTVIACSALLTTTMPVMAQVVELAEKEGLRGKVSIMVGGAPVTDDFRASIGADCYAPDAASAAEAALRLCSAGAVPC
jgi:methylmalonyl-CoA mutase cobalamin-binding domain/chain